MLTIHADNSDSLHSAWDVLPLVVSWLAGLSLGYLISEPGYISLMRSALHQPVSIVGLFICIFLPLLLSYFSILLKKPIIILVVCFIKSIAYGFSYGMITLIYSHASWLLRFLFLFSDSCMLLILITLWLNLYSSNRMRNFGVFQFSSAIAVVVAIVDYCAVSPFLESIV